MLAPLMIVVLAFSNVESLSSSYCFTNTFGTNTTYMQFTKEPIPIEYGYQGNFKSIHCCVKGYRSIEWFKDGVPYPWSAGVSGFILYPEAGNQTLYARRASAPDSGNYTCRLTNDTYTLNHTIALQILDKPTDAPKIMYISKDQYLKPGEVLHLYCEALVGRSYLADARSDLRWRRVWPNGTEGELQPSLVETKTVREDVEDIVGARASAVVSPRDYGQYACVVHTNDQVSKYNVTVYDNYSTMWVYMEAGGGGRARGAWWALAAGGGAACALAALLVGARALRGAAPALRLAAKLARAWARRALHQPTGLDKEFDVLVCWTPVDEGLVRGALLPTLRLKHKYRLHTAPLHTDPQTWYEVLLKETDRCRSLVAVVSPAQYSQPQLLVALQQLQALPLPPVVVLLQDLPMLKGEKTESARQLVCAVRRARLVPWRHLHERGFWTRLRVSLPTPPHTTIPAQAVTIECETEESKSSRCGSLTGLV